MTTIIERGNVTRGYNAIGIQVEKLDMDPRKMKLQELRKNIRVEGDNVPENVVEHVRRNLILAEEGTAICVDGRYQELQAMLARAGGDLGLSLALLKQGFSPEDAFKHVYQMRVKDNQQYGYHSDEHAEHDHSKQSGCGHCQAAYGDAELYGIESGEQVVQLLAEIKKYQDAEAENMSFVNLAGDHGEEGVFVVMSEDVTLNPLDMENGRQFFVYDAARDQKLMERLVASAAEDGVEIDLEQLQADIKYQTDATLSLLPSSQDKPMYTITVVGKELVIEFAGRTPKSREDLIKQRAA